MDDIGNVKENFDSINNNFEQDLDMARIKQDLKEKFQSYQTTMRYLAADAPIEVLCLPAGIEKALLDQGFLRIYDLFDVDLIKIKGIGIARVRQLTASLDQFFSML